MQDQSILSEILIEMQKLGKLIAISITQGMSGPEKIVMLNEVGFTNKQIAETLGVDSHPIRDALYKHRQRKPTKKTKSVNAKVHKPKNTTKAH